MLVLLFFQMQIVKDDLYHYIRYNFNQRYKSKVNFI